MTNGVSMPLSDLFKKSPQKPLSKPSRNDDSLLSPEMQKKRYDAFVKANVDDLFNEWKGKSYDQAPIHVRLIMWLKNNAGAHGYEQSGNSWVLK